MPIEATAQDTGVTDMAAFVAKHGADQALEGLQETDNAAPADQASSSPSRVPPTRETGDEDAQELDAATLQALGLAPEDESHPSGDAEEEGTEQQPIDLASLAKTLGLEAADITLDNGVLKLKTKVDGEEAQVSPDELRKGYQLQKHFTRQNEEFLQQKQAWEQARQQQEGQAQQLAQMASQVLDAEEVSLNKQYTRNWEELRESDPAEYAAQVADYNQKLNTIRQRKSGLEADWMQRQGQAYQEQAAYMQQARVAGRQALSEQLGWTDEKTFAKNGQRLRAYMTDTLGFQSQEIDGLVDPRPFVTSEKARLYDEVMRKVDLARKKIATAHKTPAGVASKPAGGQQRKLDAAKAKLAKTHSIEAAAEVFGNLKGIL